MFNFSKNLPLNVYQDSYFYQQQRKKQRIRTYKYVLLLVLWLLLAVIIVPLAQSKNVNGEVDAAQFSNQENALVHGPRLLFNHPEPNKRIALPINISADIKISGLMAYAQIEQVFVNPNNIALEGKYQFPLPENAAIKHLKIKVANKEIIGTIMEKQAAKKVYERAKRQGKKASLVQQQRANLFTNNIANIPAQSTVVVSLTFIMPVAFVNDELALNLPLAMTERYQPLHYQQSPAELPFQSQTSKISAANENTTILSSSKLSTPKLGTPSEKPFAKSRASIHVELNTGVAVSTIESASHKINTKTLNSRQSSFLITLANVPTLANRNFNLSWKLEPSQQPQVSSFTEQIADEYFTLLTFFPPQADRTVVIPRDIIFIIDTSGSMQGRAMAQAKASLHHAISLLNSDDSFNIIAFSDTTDLLFSKTQIGTHSNINQAQQFIDNLNADGGTEMYRPLSQALIMAKNKQQSAQAIRQIVFITDGAVANEFELMQLLDGTQGNFRLFTVGIGAAPNGYFMKKAAQFGRGSYVFIQNSDEIKTRISALMTKISQPALSNIQLMFDRQIQQQIDAYPKKINDLYLGEPMQVAIRSQLPITSVQLQGDTASLPWHQQLIVDDVQPSKGISTVWARSKIEDLLDSLVMGADKEQVKQQVITTSIAHQIISPYTSFIAVEKQRQPLPLTAAQPTLNANRQSAMLDNVTGLAKAHEYLMVAMPQTALGWHQQLLIGLLLMLIARLALRVSSK